MPDLTACLQTANTKQAALPWSPCPACQHSVLPPGCVSQGCGELSLLTISIGPTGGMLRLGWDTRALGTLWLQQHRCAGKVRLLQTRLKSSGYLDYELVKTSLGKEVP